MKRNWLMKSEPNEYSITDLARDGVGRWDGVRNYQVRNMMRDQMKVGDRALFYHSNAGALTGIVGEMEVVRTAYPDPTQFEVGHNHYDAKSKLEAPRWLCVDVAHRQTFPTPLLLSTMRDDPALRDFALLRRGNRLSVLPVSASLYQYLRMGAGATK
jgi:predicted RNA-binding protein with PUA-like domain